MTIGWTARTALVDKVIDRERLRRIADGLAVALACSLPWSTSATGIIAGLWLITLVPTLEPAALRRAIKTPAGGLPVLLWALGLAGMLWADVPIIEQLHGLGAFHKLLCIPLLMAQMQRADGPAGWILAAFLASCTALLVVSFALLVFPRMPWLPTTMPGIPVKNYAAQSELFTICIFALAEFTRQNWRRSRPDLTLATAALAALFLINVLLVATTRTVLVVLPLLLVLFGFRCWRWRGALLSLAGVGAVAMAAWFASPFFQVRVGSFMTEVHEYQTANLRNSAGERLEFWKKSIGFVTQAPWIGHGTGSIADQFRRSAGDEGGASAVVSSNPHNQTLAIAIQLGLLGTAVLFALWAAHLWLFRGMALAAWIGFVVVMQNVVGSLFNSQLFDFTHGWAYVIGVGVCGGAMLGRIGRASRSTGAPRAP
jgi:O-antigen ligase